MNFFEYKKKNRKNLEFFYSRQDPDLKHCKKIMALGLWGVHEGVPYLKKPGD